MKKILSALAALILGVGLAGTAAMSASAHTGDLDVTAACNTQTGQYDLTATLTISQTGLAGDSAWWVGNGTFAGTPSSAPGTINGTVHSTGAGTITLGTFSIPGTTTGLGPWVYAYTVWSDSYAKGSDGQLTTALGGDCSVPVTPSVSASVTGVATCAPASSSYTVKWTGTVTGVFDGYTAQRVKYLGTTPPTLVQDGKAPGTSFTYTTTEPGDATSASATFHVHVTKAAAGVDPLDTDATGTVQFPGVCALPTVTITQECGSATVVFTNGTKYAFAGDVRVDDEAPSQINYYGLGDFYQIVNIPSYGSVTKTYSFTEDSGDHTVAARIGLGAEQDWYVAWQSVTVGTDCEPPVQDASAALVFTDETCAASGTVDLGPIANAVWGDLTVDENGHYSVTATANANHAFPGGDATLTLSGDLPGATGFQDTDSEALCYVEPKEDDVTVEEGTPTCGATEIAVTTTTIHYTLDPATGEFVAGEPVVTHSTRAAEKGEVKECPPLAYTGVDSSMLGGVAFVGLMSLLAGVGVLGRVAYDRRKTRSGSAE
jgi:hypothetical protein